MFKLNKIRVFVPSGEQEMNKIKIKTLFLHTTFLAASTTFYLLQFLPATAIEPFGTLVKQPLLKGPPLIAYGGSVP